MMPTLVLATDLRTQKKGCRFCGSNERVNVKWSKV